jgi:NarL family two-component system sensor histidine kinase YdfH
MALIGETIGFLGLNRWSALSTIYYISLSLANFVIFTNFDNASYWLLTIIPTVIFVGLYVTLYMRQTEARERAQILAAELETANIQLTEYAARVEDLSIANERQRMARELHDTLSQGLAGIILQLEATEAHLANNHPEKAQNIISNAKQQARSTLAGARAAIDDLRTPLLDDLDSALRLEISQFTGTTGIPCHFQADPTSHLPAPILETIIRAVTESLTNIARYAEAKKVEMKLSTTDQHLWITIQDDGKGFDPENIPPGHYGILGIHERLRLHNGKLTINSAPNQGTVVTIQIPIPS